MTRMWIVVGDMTSSGGRVIAGSQYTDIDGKPVARVGDRATCPLHQGVFPIADGDPTTIIDGHPVALHGSKLACGCAVLSVQQMRVFVDSDAAARQASTGSSAGSAAAPISPIGSTAQYDQAFVLESADGLLLTGRHYRILREDGGVETGTTDAQGMTHLVKSSRAEALELQLMEEGP